MDEVQVIQKLDRFTESVNSEVDEHISSIIDEANRLSSEKLSKTEDDELLDAFNKIQKSVRDIESRYRRLYALEEQKCRMDVLKHREVLANEIFANVKKKIYDFAASEKYGDYLLEAVKGEKLSDSAVVVISPKDEKYGIIITEKYNYKFRTDESIELGGLMLVDDEQGLIIDKTFDSELEEQKKSFSSRYSFKSGN